LNLCSNGSPGKVSHVKGVRKAGEDKAEVERTCFLRDLFVSFATGRDLVTKKVRGGEKQVSTFRFVDFAFQKLREQPTFNHCCSQCQFTSRSWCQNESGGPGFRYQECLAVIKNNNETSALNNVLRDTVDLCADASSLLNS
jgi:hypothetical protein